MRVEQVTDQERPVQPAGGSRFGVELHVHEQVVGVLEGGPEGRPDCLPGHRSDLTQLPRCSAATFFGTTMPPRVEHELAHLDDVDRTQADDDPVVPLIGEPGITNLSGSEAMSTSRSSLGNANPIIYFVA